MASSLPAHRLLVVVALLLSSLVCGPAYSQSNPDKQTAAKVLRLVKDANDEFDRGEFSDALNLYEQAYELYPDAVLLYRIGLSADNAGSLRRAVEAYEAFVAAAKSDDATAQKVNERIVEIKASIPPRLTVTTNPAGADIFVGDLEGASLGQAPGDFDVPPGEITVLVRLSGYKLEKRSVTMANGDLSSLDVELEQLEGLADPNDPPKPPVEGGKGIGLGGWGWVTTGVGVALLGTGTTFAILASSATKDVNEYDKRAPGASRAQLEELKTTANSRHSTSVALLVGGGVVTGIGVTLIVIDALRGDSESAGIAPALGFGGQGAWVGFTGRF